jgi:hypothetical protein
LKREWAARDGIASSLFREDGSFRGRDVLATDPVALEREAVAAALKWYDVISDKMTASASREWLQTTLQDFLRQGLIERLKVIEAADKGDDIADAALRQVYAEMRECGQEPPANLKAYGIRAVLRGPVARTLGRYGKYDNWRRDIGLACLIYLVHYRFRLLPTRTRWSRHERTPSACSIVRIALHKRGIKVSESRLNNLWGNGLGARLVAFLVNEQ